MSTIYTDAQKRHDFVFLFDVTNGNPNGDPDAGNLPRTDPETQHGIVTDVCIKRKIRNYVDMQRGSEDRYKIYIQIGKYLVDEKRRCYRALNIPQGSNDRIDDARNWMCANFYDIRTFGGVLVGKTGKGKKEESDNANDDDSNVKKSKKGKQKDDAGGYNCGQVRGPMQLTFARSIHPVLSLDLTITRVAQEYSGEAPSDEEEGEARTGTMGRKALLPYGLYKGYGFYSPMLAKGTGFSNDDLALFWEAMQNMFGIDRSASRGWMELRGLYVFTHEKPIGNAPSHKLFPRIEPKLRASIETPRKFEDYGITVDDKDLPSGVTLSRVIE